MVMPFHSNFYSFIMSTLEYELIEISFTQKYDVEGDESFKPQYVHDDGGTDTEGEKPAIQYDADGIPMGQSMEEIRIREGIIDAFFRKWVENHPEKYVLNENLEDKINVRVVSIIEAKQHAAKSYKSTLAVMNLDDVLRHAQTLEEMPPKKGNKNQASFERMILMSYQCEGVGIVKLTVGVRRSNKDKVQYGISAVRDGEVLVPQTENKTAIQRKRKAPHKK